MRVQDLPQTIKEVPVDLSTNNCALLKPNSSASVHESSAKPRPKSSIRRLRTETFYQKNIDDVLLLPDPSKSDKVTTNERSDHKPPQKIDIVVAIVVLAKLEMVLINLDDQMLKPINAEITGLRREVLSLQQQLSDNGKLIERLQAEVALGQVAEIQLDVALKNNERLLAELSNRLHQHNDLIGRLEEGILNNAAISQELRDLIAENKKVIDQMQNAVHDIEEIENILVKYGNNADGLPALHAAIKKGDIRAVELLIQHGADVNTIMTSNIDAKNGLSALAFAALEKKEAIVKLLLDKGADINGGITRTYFDAQSQSEKISWAKTSIHFAAESGDVNIIKLLHERGADINVNANKHRDNPDHFYTPLHFAAEHGNFEAIVALVELGANVNAGRVVGRWTNGRTPLDFASKLLYADNPKNLDLVKFLVENGAYRNFPDGNNHVPCPIIKAYLQSKGR